MNSWGIAILFYVFIALWSLEFVRRFNYQLNEMIGMMSAMASGMIIGFGSGMISVVLFSSNLLLSTMISVLIGIVAGGVIGIIVSLSAFLNGALSGMMSGMMGVMLMSMVPLLKWNRFVFFFMILLGALQFVHTLILQSQLQKETLNVPWSFKSPALMLTVIIILIFLYSLNVHAVSEYKTTTQQNISSIMSSHSNEKAH